VYHGQLAPPPALGLPASWLAVLVAVSLAGIIFTILTARSGD
jgi:hypothetical protein